MTDRSNGGNGERTFRHATVMRATEDAPHGLSEGDIEIRPGIVEDSTTLTFLDLIGDPVEVKLETLEVIRSEESLTRTEIGQFAHKNSEYVD